MNRSNVENERRNALVRMIAGAGLVVAGVALYLFLRGMPGGSVPSSEARSVAPVEVRYAAPLLSLTNLQGATESLADHHGLVVLVNNWATWCPPCKAEMPTLESYYEEHAAQGFTIVAIEAGDGAEDVQPFVQEYGLQFPVWLDPHGAALAAFRNPNLPNSYVLDRRGMVRYAWTGEISRNMLEKYVTPLIGEDQALLK